MAITTTGFSHVRLTVRDIEASRRFYDAVFGWEVAFELPADADEETREQLWFLFGGVIYQVPGGLFGLRPVAPGDDTFSENRVGLDHVAFAVPTRAELDRAIEVLDTIGASREDVKDAGAMWILEFRDPDGIALELSAPK